MARKRSENVLTVKEIMDAANRRYRDEYINLRDAYDEQGRVKEGEGDLISEYIVTEIREAYLEGQEAGASDEEIVEEAIRKIRDAMRDMEKATRGLEELMNAIQRTKSRGR